MLIPCHPYPPAAEAMLAHMRTALTRAREWELTAPQRAAAWGTLAATALDEAIRIDAAAAA